jgi:iron complex transport system substrate-binding protein
VRTVLGLGLAIAMALALGGCRSRARTHGDKTPRLVSLMPSGTEVVAALGAADLLVGVDNYSTYPPEVAKLPKVGSYLTPDLESIVRLQPTLVIVDDIHGQAANALHQAGIATIECSIQTLPDVKHALHALGARLGRAKQAAAVVAAIDATIDAAAAHRPARPRVLLVIDREAGGLGNLVAAGPGSWVDELLAIVGGENVLAGASVRYPKLSLEEVIRAQPDVIVDQSSAGGGTAPWQQLVVPAVKNGRVVALSAKAAPDLVAPSPRVRPALDALARAIAPPAAHPVASPPRSAAVAPRCVARPLAARRARGRRRPYRDRQAPAGSRSRRARELVTLSACGWSCPRSTSRSGIAWSCAAQARESARTSWS